MALATSENPHRWREHVHAHQRQHVGVAPHDGAVVGPVRTALCHRRLVRGSEFGGEWQGGQCGGQERFRTIDDDANVDEGDHVGAARNEEQVVEPISRGEAGHRRVRKTPHETTRTQQSYARVDELGPVWWTDALATRLAVLEDSNSRDSENIWS